MADTSRRSAEEIDLVTALVGLRGAIGPLVEDLLGGIQPSFERWLEFADVIAHVVDTCRRQVAVAARANQEPPGQPS
jgi:hypothetical protein